MYSYAHNTLSAIIKYSYVLYVQYVDKQCVYLYMHIIYVGGNFREVELLFLPEFRRRNFEFTFPRPQQRTIHHSVARTTKSVCNYSSRLAP